MTLVVVLACLATGVGDAWARSSLRPVAVSRADGAIHDTAIAVFAGGCFWSMERPFEHVPGVISTLVGYDGGGEASPSYNLVNSGKTGYAESVQVTYDPSRVSYSKLLDVYWRNVDPFTREAQFCDHGHEYRTVIFYADSAQKLAAERSRDAVASKLTGFGPVLTEIAPMTRFWPAESYHQHYADHYAVRYAVYRLGCGRDERLSRIWGDSAEPYVPSK